MTINVLAFQLECDRLVRVNAQKHLTEGFFPATLQTIEPLKMQSMHSLVVSRAVTPI